MEVTTSFVDVLQQFVPASRLQDFRPFYRSSSVEFFLIDTIIGPRSSSRATT